MGFMQHSYNVNLNYHVVPRYHTNYVDCQEQLKIYTALYIVVKHVKNFNRFNPLYFSLIVEM